MINYFSALYFLLVCITLLALALGAAAYFRGPNAVGFIFLVSMIITAPLSFAMADVDAPNKRVF